jgi:hypothetical protein
VYPQHALISPQHRPPGLISSLPSPIPTTTPGCWPRECGLPFVLRVYETWYLYTAHVLPLCILQETEACTLGPRQAVMKRGDVSVDVDSYPNFSASTHPLQPIYSETCLLGRRGRGRGRCAHHMDRNTRGWVPASDSEGLVGMHGVAIVFAFAYREYISALGLFELVRNR